jgi:hypothetical protein
MPNVPVCDCGKPQTKDDYCIACYERVVREKPLIAWRLRGTKKYRRGTDDEPIDGNWENLPDFLL